MISALRLMPTSCFMLRVRALPLAGSLLCFAFITTRAAQSPPAAAAGSSPAAAKAAPAQPELPKSIFRVPASPKEGRDPFYPLSALRTAPVVTTNNVVVAPPAELELKGISGPPDHRLAIINNRTFEVGEEGTVLSNVGRVRIVCKEINADSVRVLLNGEPRTLTLRSR